MNLNGPKERVLNRRARKNKRESYAITAGLAGLSIESKPRSASCPLKETCHYQHHECLYENYYSQEDPMRREEILREAMYQNYILKAQLQWVQENSSFL